MKTLIRTAALAAAMAFTAASLAADLKVGLNVSMSGPNSSIGIPYAKGMQAALAYKPEINGRKVQLIVLDDASDPTAAGRNARKLIEEDKVDVLMGASGVPASVAMAQVGKEAKTPMIGLSPLALDPADNPWVVTVAQPPQLMIAAVVERMKRNGAPEWVADTIFATAAAYNISAADIMFGLRTYDVVDARHAAIYAVKATKPVLSSTLIAKWFGIDHTTVLNSMAAHSHKTGAPSMTKYKMRPRYGYRAADYADRSAA